MLSPGQQEEPGHVTLFQVVSRCLGAMFQFSQRLVISGLPPLVSGLPPLTDYGPS